MDRMLYVAMTGARQNMLAQAVNANNLANISTTGFRADLAEARSMPLFGDGYPTRVYAMTQREGTDFNPGPIQTTGRSLDVAIENKGFFAVQTTDGSEAYTRAGNFRVSSTGILETASGHAVLGDSGPISVPVASRVDIGGDGTISILPQGGTEEDITVIDRLKLVNPDVRSLFKANDGLFRLKKSGNSEADADVRLVSGALEGSNVNAASAMVNMIELARQFEMQVKMMRLAEKNDEQAAKLLYLA